MWSLLLYTFHVVYWKNRSCTWDLGTFWIMPLYGADHRRPIQEVVRPFASLFNGTSSKKMSYMSSCCIYIFYQQICFEYRRLLAASFCKSWQTAWLLCGVVSYFLAPVPNVGTKKGAWTSHIGPSFRRRRRILLLFFDVFSTNDWIASFQRWEWALDFFPKLFFSKNISASNATRHVPASVKFL